MILSKDAQDALNFIRKKVVSGQYDFDKIQLQSLALVFEEIQLKATNKKRTLDISCGSCVKNAANIALNFIKYHEEIVPERSNTIQRITISSGEVEVQTEPQKTIEQSIEDRFDLTKMTVEELKQICDEQGIKYHYKAGEKKLIEAILAAQADQ